MSDDVFYELPADYKKRVADVLLDTRPDECSDIICEVQYYDADRVLIGTTKFKISQQNDDQTAILKALQP